MVSRTNGDGSRTTASSAGTLYAYAGFGRRALVTGGLWCGWSLLAAGRAGARANGDDKRITASSVGARGLLPGLGARWMEWCSRGCPSHASQPVSCSWTCGCHEAFVVGDLGPDIGKVLP